MEIYLITNNVTKQNYVGQTIWDFKDRYHGCWHKWTHNNYLKNSVKKYGLDSFSVLILEENVPDDNDWLNNLEDYYIKKYNCIYPNGYNFQEGGKFGYRRDSLAKKYELKDVNGNIYKIVNLKQFCVLNKLNYGAMLNMVSGINTSSQGYALSSTPTKKILNLNQEWELEEIKTGIIYTIKRKDLTEFAENKGINVDYLQKITRKECYVSHGFKLKETILDGDKIRPEIQKYKDIKFINPQGEETVINNIYKFCMENNLPRSGFYDLISGKALICQGWRMPMSEKEFSNKRELRMGKFIKIKNIKTNEILEIKNISKFCRDNQIPLGTFNTMLHGSIQQYMGFCLPETDLTKYKYPKKVVYISMKSEDGRVVEGSNAKDIENRYRIMTSQSIQDMINKKYNSIKGWKVTQVKYLHNYYPEINNI